MAARSESFPLSGIRILDFTHVLAGPFCTRLLADLGADVVKVESELRPDRLGAAFPKSDYQGRTDRTGTFLSFNRSKRSLAINLKLTPGRALAQQLAAKADVVVENFSAGVLERLGLGYDRIAERNPGLVYLSLSGFGHSGPRRHGRSMNMTLQAYSGMMTVNGKEGQPPMSIANSWNDFIGGFHGALATVNALGERVSSGKGARIDIAQFECSVSTIGALVFASAVDRKIPEKTGNRSPSAAPQGVYRCAGRDEWCAITVRSGAEWAALVDIAGIEEYRRDTRLARFIERMRRHDEIDRRISEWTGSRTAEDVEQSLRRAGVPARRMSRANDVLDAGTKTGVLRLLDDPPGWSTLVGGIPFTLDSGLPAPVPAPRLGEHSRSVLQDWLGLSENEIEGLSSENAFEGVST